MTSRVRRTIQSLADILTKEQTAILKTAGLLMVPALLTKITGLIFSLLTATQLGTGTSGGSSQALNEFLLANELPQLLADILLTGAISTLVIPIFIQVREEEGETAFRRFYNTVVNIVLGIFAVVSIIVILFADSIMPLVLEYVVRPTPEVYASLDIPNVVSMVRALMLPQLILGISVFVTSGLNVYHRFMIPQLAPLFYNLGRIFSVFILLPLMDKSPWALVIGVYIGAVLHLLIQIPLARSLELRFKWTWDWKIKYLRNFIAVAWPRLIAYTADTLGGTFSRLIVAGFNQGFFSVMFYANSLASVVPGIVGYAFSVASFPTLSRLYTHKQYAEMNEIVIKSVNQIVFLALPIVMATMVLRLPIVRLVYGLIPGTSFDRLSTLMVAWALLFFAMGIIFYSTKWYLYRLFYVAQNTVLPLALSVLSLVLTIGLTFLFTNLFSHAHTFSFGSVVVNIGNLTTRGSSLAAVGGAALALSTVAAVEFFVLLWLVNKVVIRIDFKDLFIRVLRKLIPAVISGALMYAMYRTWDIFSFPIDAQPGFVGSTTFNLFILTSLTVFTSFMVYYLLCYLFDVEELKILRRILNPLFKLGGLRIE